MLKTLNKGFTIIEMLIVITIFVVIISIIVLPLFKNRQYRLLLKSTDEVVSVLSKARSNTLSSVGSEQYGVKIESDKVILFTGSVYDQNSVSNKISRLDEGVEISASQVLLNGSVTSVVFDRLTGATSGYGTITLRLVTDTSKTKTITIEKTGIIKIN